MSSQDPSLTEIVASAATEAYHGLQDYVQSGADKKESDTQKEFEERTANDREIEQIKADAHRAIDAIQKSVHKQAEDVRSEDAAESKEEVPKSSKNSEQVAAENKKVEQIKTDALKAIDAIQKSVHDLADALKSKVASEKPISEEQAAGPEANPVQPPEQSE